MNSNLKKVLAVFLATLMLSCTVPFVFAEEVTNCTTCGDEDCIHNYETVVTDPKCTEKGYTTYTCTCGCGYSYVDNYVDATEGAPESENTVSFLQQFIAWIYKIMATFTQIISKLGLG